MSRIRADKFVNSGATGAPQLTFGAEVVAGVGLTGAGGINITGIATATSFSGNVTGNISGGTVAGSTGTFTGDVDIADKIVHTGDTNTAIRFPAADTFTVETGGSERLRITSSGEVQIANGNLKFTTSGTGIDFSATNDPGGMTSELLDDYEEGTWTPTIGGNATYTNQVGTYVKVGRMVYAHWALTINAQGTGSNISAIDGLPYPSGVASQATSNLLWSGFGVSMAYAAYYVGNGSTLMNLSYIATAAAALTNNPNGLVNGATMNGTIVYYSSY